MTTCCQNTSSPTGKLCGDCPLKPAAPVNDMSPEAIGARLKKSNLRGDEPWPGWSGGKPIPPPPVDDEESSIVEGYGSVAAPPFDEDPEHWFDKIIETFKEMIETETIRGGMIETKTIRGGMFATGGVIYPSGQRYEIDPKDWVQIPFEPKKLEEIVGSNPLIVNYSPPCKNYTSEDQRTVVVNYIAAPAGTEEVLNEFEQKIRRAMQNNDIIRYWRHPVWR